MPIRGVKSDPKPLPRPKRKWRKRATKKEWEALRTEKLHGWACRTCWAPAESLHHLLPRSLGGDDVADNLVGLCGSGTTGCHGKVEARNPFYLAKLAEYLSDGEYSYLHVKCGENCLSRLFGV